MNLDEVSSLDFGPYKFVPLEGCDLDSVCEDLDHPSIMQVANLKRPDMSIKEILERRLAMSLAADHLNLIVFDHKGRAYGWVGLIECASDPAVYETSTYFHSDVWGSGANLYGKSLLWQIIQGLGHSHAVISINKINERSIRGNRKIFLDSFMEEVYEPSKERVSVNIHMDRAPKGFVELSERQKKDLRDLIAPLAFGRRHSIES